MIEVYTDGSCWPNPGGPGGWAWVVDESTFGFGGVESSTNQRMEVWAAFQAVNTLDGDLMVVTDSMYLINCATGKWRRKANVDMWDELIPLLDWRSQEHGWATEFRWVKGHSGVRLNEVADRLALAGQQGVTVDQLLARQLASSSGRVESTTGRL